MLELKSISKVYSSKTERIDALLNVSYKFESGKFYAIMGHSGSGKSTLISIMGLICDYSEGEYLIDNQNVAKLNEMEKSNLRNKKIGFVFQDYYLDLNLRAYENVILPMFVNKNFPKSERKSKAIELLTAVGVETRANHYPKEMSGGEQQRVCLARALANNPSIILADEPTGNLDEENEKKIFEILKKLTEDGKCVIVVSHSNEIKKYADIMLTMKNGKLV